jgi:valyl-tRNA synthetase
MKRVTFLPLTEKHFAPEKVEEGVYALWEERKAFKSGHQPEKKPYSIVIPPPNVTGRLHMGHALNNTLQDMIIRYKRMDSYDACWIPGTDHAGISTQSVVKKQLQAEGIDLREYGREKTIERIWEWKEKYGNKILEQLRKMGCSCDWDRTAFTMSDSLSLAVREAFVRLFEAGLIYRGRRIVNWCPVDQTALSNDETYNVEGGEPGHLWYFKYPRVDGKGVLVIATTRPETMFGDVAVAVNPRDSRYADLIGSKVRLPLMDKEIPIIGDDYVDMEFGTGCLKITPAHDPNDFEIGERHNLEPLSIMHPDGRLNDEVPPSFRGLDRYEAREKAVDALRALGLVEKIEDRLTPLVRAERSKVVIEYRLSDQWFVKMKPLADKALEVGQAQGLKFYPERWGGVYRSWLENTRDWCISRQIWWGHRIPAWYHISDGRMIVSRDECPVEVQKEPGMWRQDDDVLDTWFSSALWPYSTFGWPRSTSDLERFYPTSVLVTAKDIIYLWVARMVMTGVFNLQRIPFNDVLINPLVCDENGEGMSKSKGNGIDPLHIIDGAPREELEEIVLEARPIDTEQRLQRIRDRYPDGFQGVGADALRFSLATLNVEAQQVGLSLRRFEEVGRPFTDKLWNACRFVLAHIDQVETVPAGEPRIEDSWILGQLDRAISAMRSGLDSYRGDVACEQAYHFFWDDFCDWYVELVKPRLRSGDKGDRKRVQEIIAEVLSAVIRALHPIVPFITEELWGHFYPRAVAGNLLSEDQRAGDLCVLAPYPRDGGRFELKASLEFERLRGIVRSIRTARVDAKLASKALLSVKCRYSDDSLRILLARAQDLLHTSAGLKRFEEVSQEGEVTGWSAIVVEGATLYLDLAEFRDVAAERVKAHKSLEGVLQRLAQFETKLSNQDFIARAPAHVVEKERASFAELQAQRDELQEVLRGLGS